jgi:molybdopterin-guanine dinucleotide biosynthesis protein A
MGRDKALVELDGVTMLDRVIEAVRAEVRDVVIVGRSIGSSGVEALPDDHRGPLGPLSGLVTALDRFQRPVLLFAADQPLLRTETVRRMVRIGGPSDAVVPVDGKLQVTCARYPCEWLEPARDMLAGGGSLRALVRSQPHIEVPPAEWATWSEDGRSWYSLDDDAAIIAAEQRFRIDLPITS